MGNFNLGMPVMGVEEVAEDHGRWLIHGPQGSGKSYLASTVADLGKTLYIDLVGEKGVRSFKGSPQAQSIDVIRPTSITQMDDLFYKLNEGGHGYKAVVIDSLTSVQKMTMRYLLGHDETAVKEIKQGTAPADIRTWGQALDVMVDTATFWYGLADGQRGEDAMHVVMTAQTKITQNEETGTLTRQPDVQKGALSITLATPDYVVYTDVEEDMDAVGDDSMPPFKHILRFGSDPDYKIKARIPHNLRGKVPPILGRGKNPPNLAQLSKVLGIAGLSTGTRKKTASTQKENAR